MGRGWGVAGDVCGFRGGRKPTDRGAKGGGVEGRGGGGGGEQGAGGGRDTPGYVMCKGEIGRGGGGVVTLHPFGMMA